MGEIAADAHLFLMGIPRRAIGTGELVSEPDPVVNIVHDGLHAAPAEIGLAEQRPRHVGEPLGVAIAAAQQEDEYFIRQLVHGMLPRAEAYRIRKAPVFNDEVALDRKSPGGATRRVQRLPKASM